MVETFQIIKLIFVDDSLTLLAELLHIAVDFAIEPQCVFGAERCAIW